MMIVDSHTHVFNLEENSAPLYALAERLNYHQLTVQSLQCTGELWQNAYCAYLKHLHPKTTYAFGGFDYVTSRDPLTQAKNLIDMGFDGIKMLEGKPTTRSTLGIALNDPQYDAFFSYAEETGFPVLFHVADPPEFWDAEKVPDWAKEQGWFYDETHVPFDQYYDEVEDMLNKHPKLRAIFAHFYFLSGEPERAQKFLDKHPCVFIDITAGIEMYENFSKDTALWRAFFIKNSHRIIFGTDSMDAPETADGNKVDISGYAKMEIDFVRTGEEIAIFGKKIRGLNLPEDVQRQILGENFHGLVGKTPRLLDSVALSREIEFIRPFINTDQGIASIDQISAQLQKSRRD